MDPQLATDVFVCQRFRAAIPLSRAWRDLTELQRLLQPQSAGVEALLMRVDGRRLLWHLRVREHEALQTATTWAGTEAAMCWPVTLRELGSERPANVVVEHPDLPRPPPAPLSEDLHALCRLTHRVEAVREAVSADGKTRFSFYHAPDTDSVRYAQRHGAVADGRVWSFRVVG